ncbi:MAG: glycerol-3-phosphate dehydrogenase [Gammaproteobacteria bacterium]|nr:MAG: glycerol-3-phosphate dehydrogenase [Gammaproteobacteria bacterium]RLA60813.1 MAG: glycerol-3-phosphate dehydrogenase [Gammaproteobacteria bacterium]
MSRQTLHTDIAIIGGGIAGLWALNQLRNRGYSAILFEQGALGSDQTIGSQGMIHGGIKYALGGAWSGDSQTISAMPSIWRGCLAGTGKVDLRACKVLSESFYLWSSASLQSRLTSFFASKMLRGRVEKLKADDYPVPLQAAAFHGQVYQLIDLVLDVPSLVQTLARQQRQAIFSIDWHSASLRRDNGRATLALPHCTVVPERLLLTAGSGNETLITALGGAAPAMQRRPLQQVLVKHQYRENFFAHCMGGSPSPRLTISSHRTRADEPVWYLGGDLATEGVDNDPQQQIDKARRELTELLPWIDLGRTQWRTLRLDRAEPRQSTLLRPDSAFVGKVDSVHNTLAAWPTKLTLSPDLADQIQRRLMSDNILPRYRPDLSLLQSMGQPPIAAPYWDTLFR